MKPNILIFFTDQQRWDTAGCYGNPMGLTPTLDAMAARGTLFEYAFTCQPVCGPARACLQTGIYATKTGVFRNAIPMDKDEKTIAHYLKEAGYDTAYTGKWHLSEVQGNPIPQKLRSGYDYFAAVDGVKFTTDPYGGYVWSGDNQKMYYHNYRADGFTDFALDYLDTRKETAKEKPFFLMHSILEPHHSVKTNTHDAPTGYAERYSENYFVPGDLKGLDTGDYKENLPAYYGMVKSCDENLERVIEKLKEIGQFENTVIIFATDHGSHFKTRGDEYKRSCHESSIRIPLVISGPGFDTGKTVTELVSLIDIPETVLDIAGINLDSAPQMQGRSVFPLISGEEGSWPQDVFVQISESQVARAIRTKRWKFSIRAWDKHGWHDMDSEVYNDDALFDLDADPYELNNLVNEPGFENVRIELRERLSKRMVEAGESAPEILDSRKF